jgi:hypothetical protein
MSNAAGESFAIVMGLLLGLVLALDVGFRLGRRAARRGDSPDGGQVGAIQGAVLGLLGLLLAFSFSAAASRFLERQDLIVQEANAVGTAYLRADLLDAPHAARVRQVLGSYVRHRIEASKSLAQGLAAETEKQVAEFHAQLWEAARDGALERPSTMVVVLDPINEVIDLHSTRVFAGRKHLPPLVLGLLIGCSLLAMAVIGYGCGLGNRRSAPMTMALTILITISLWTTIDLDHPRSGIIRLSDAPLEQLDLPGVP